MVNLFAFPASREEAYANYRKTIEKPVNDDVLKKYLGNDYDRLRNIYPSGPIYAWGATPKNNNIRVWEKMQIGDFVVSYVRGNIDKLFRIIGKVHNRDFAAELWGFGHYADNRGMTWEYMYFLQHIADIKRRSPIIIRGHTHLIGEAKNEIEKVIEEVLHKSLDEISNMEKQKLIERTLKRKVKPDEVKQVLGFAHSIIDKISKGDYSVPNSWSRHQVRIGQGVFRLILLEMYGYRCVICGLNIPDLLEVAHLKPWSKYPEDRLNPNNALLLCSIHHKALDRGFIEIIEEDGKRKVKCTEKVRNYEENDMVKELIMKYDGMEIKPPEVSLEEAIRRVEELFST